MEIKKQYVVDEQNRPVAVQIDLQTFQRIEEVLEDYALAHLIQESEGDDVLDLEEAWAFYASLPKTE